MIVQSPLPDDAFAAFFTHESILALLRCLSSPDSLGNRSSLHGIPQRDLVQAEFLRSIDRFASTPPLSRTVGAGLSAKPVETDLGV